MDFRSLIFMLIIILLYTLQNFYCKKFSSSYEGKEENATPVLTIFGGIIVSIVSFFFSGCIFDAEPLTIILGIINAFALYGYNFFLLKASASGPYSVLIVFSIAGGISLPSLAKWIGFDERMSYTAMAFLLLIMLSVYLMSLKKVSENDSSSNKITPAFLLYSLCLGICNGVYAAILAIQQEYTGKSNKEELIMITFICAAAISFVLLLIKKQNIFSALKQTKKSGAHLLIYALSAAFAVNSLVIIMLFDIETGVLYTVQNAGVMLLSVILSVLVFKEKLTKINVVGCILMSIGLVGITVFA